MRVDHGRLRLEGVIVDPARRRRELWRAAWQVRSRRWHAAATLQLGFPRVCFSFFAGVALARLHRSRTTKICIPSWAMLLLLAISFSAPLRGASARLYDLGCLFVIFPAFIHWGATAVEKRPKLGEKLGETSYCLYAIHYPLAKLAVLVFTTFPIARIGFLEGKRGSAIGEILFILVVIPISYAVTTYYDLPARRLINNHNAESA